MKAWHDEVHCNTVGNHSHWGLRQEDHEFKACPFLRTVFSKFLLGFIYFPRSEFRMENSFLKYLDSCILFYRYECFCLHVCTYVCTPGLTEGIKSLEL